MTNNGTSRHAMPAASFGLQRDPFGRLVLIDSDGRRHVGVEAVRAFPISDPTRFISLCDEHGRELVCVDDLDSLPANLRAAIDDDLIHREFVPVIQRLVRVSGDVGPTSKWEAETDRGPVTFSVSGEDDIRILGLDKAMITDTHGVRYLVPDVRALDGVSRRILERFL